MRRWNGWGDEKVFYALPGSAASYLDSRIGKGLIIPDSSLVNIIKRIPQTRLDPHPLIVDDPLHRLMHARGQSIPDWVAMRHGTINLFPDGTAYPKNDEEVRELIRFAQLRKVRLIPYGGGTSVVGHINPTASNDPLLTVDLSHFNQLLDLDETSLLATFGAGINGPALEKKLGEKHYTLGHFPQSFELSTLGGWIATRSSGQQSYYYGRIEDLFAAGHIETGAGSIDLPPLPASAAGPDLRQLFLGSEGRFGIITRATVRIRRLPECDDFYGIFFHNWEEGVSTIRHLAQEGVQISMARLSNPEETMTTLQLSGKEDLLKWADRGLNLLKYPDGRVLMILGVTGDRKTTRSTRQRALQISRRNGGLFVGTIIGNIWRKSRFYTPYLRNTLWENGYAIDTLETALPWSKILDASQRIPHVIQESGAKSGERILAFAHLSHIYRDGASLYVTYIFRRTKDPDEILSRWQEMKSAASEEIIAYHGTISHQHGVGTDHSAYLMAEKGPIGIEILRQTGRLLDPQGILNPGKLID